MEKKSLDRPTEHRIRSNKNLPARFTKAEQLEEIVDHPLLTLLHQVNPIHNAFDLWELTTLYQEVHGSAFWKLNTDPFGVPNEIWILPTQNMEPKRRPGSANLVDYYEYRTGSNSQQFQPEEIIHFRYPDPRNPYTSGLSPLRACWEQAAAFSDFTAFKKSKFENRAIPDAVVTPDEVIGEDERERFESEWNMKLRQGGAGKVVVGESNLKVQLLQQSMGDPAALADAKANKEDIANAFHVPIAFLTSQTNMANLQASERLHMDKAISPRLTSRDEKLNEQLVPLFDPTGRLFLSSDDPVPVDMDQVLSQLQTDMKYGIVTINEIRGDRGLPEVEWGNVPWLPLIWAPTDLPERPQYAPHESKPKVGRAKPKPTDAET